MDNQLQLIKKIFEAISKAEKILLIAHERPDGDTLGSVAAFSIFLDQLKKDYKIYCSNPLPPFFNFLPNAFKFADCFELDPEIKYDLLVAIDCGDLKRTGLAEIIKNYKHDYQLINIDHHNANPLFGHLNLVRPEASSTAEIIFDLFKEWKVVITKDMATALLNGIFTDTGAFANTSTNFNSLLSASQLINYGGKLQDINRYAFNNKTISSLKLWGRGMERLTINNNYQIAYTVILGKDLEEFRATENDLEGLSNLFNNLTGVKASLVLKEDGEFIRGSLRSVDAETDVSKLARFFGGGGHIKASGFTIKGRLVENGKGWKIE
jgi:phosphoesterase RecJ-like protein